jgi:hypothetical protein
LAISPRPVTVVNPEDATGAVMREEQFRNVVGQRARLLTRKAGDPLPLD